MVPRRREVKERPAKATEDDAIAAGNSGLMKYRCIVHEGNLCAKALKMDNIMQIMKTEFHRGQGIESSPMPGIPWKS